MNEDEYKSRQMLLTQIIVSTILHKFCKLIALFVFAPTSFFFVDAVSVDGT